MARASTTILTILMMLASTTISTSQMIAVGSFANAIMKDLGLSHSEMGLILSLSFASSIVSSLPTGILIDTLGPYKILAISLTLVSIGTLTASIATNHVALAISRLIAGIGMPAVWPSCAKIVALEIPPRVAGLSTSAYDIGSLAGLSIAYALASYYGGSWRETLFGLGIAGFTVSLLPLLRVFRSTERAVETPPKLRGAPNTTALRIKVRYSEMIHISAAFLMVLQLWFFFATWGFAYLVEEFSASPSDLWVFNAVALLLGSIVSFVSGAISDRLEGLGGVKKILTPSISIASLSLALSALGIYPILSTTMSIVFFRLAAPMFWLIINRSFDPEEVGRVGGIYIISVQISGLVSPAMVGFLREYTGSFKPSIALISLMGVSSALLYHTFRRGQKGRSTVSPG